MSPSATANKPKDLSEREKSALVVLLGDDDKATYPLVRDKILSYGPQVTAWLRPFTLSSDPLLRRRAQEIIQHLTRQEADNRFLSFCVSHGEDLDLEEGIWLLARTQYPDINLDAYRALLDAFAADLRERIALEESPMSILAAINDYLFTNLGFVGNQENYYDPDNSYFNRVVDRRTGNPISLCALYWLIGRRLKLPIVGIGMPGHFLCRFQGLSEAFFIDAFNRGKLLSRADCIKYLQHSSHGFQDSFLAPIMPGRALLRMCSNLHQIYSHLEMRDETARFQRYLVALAK